MARSGRNGRRQIAGTEETSRTAAVRAEQDGVRSEENQPSIEGNEDELSASQQLPTAGAGAGNQVGLEAVLERLTQILGRLPAVAPATDEPPREHVPVETVAEGAQVVAAPSYLKMMDHMQKLGTQFFSGGARPIEADEWRSRLERNFNSIRCPEEFKCDIAVHYLEGDAHNWWRGVSSRMGNSIRSWETFCREFQAKYFPPEAFDRLEGAFLNLCQGSRTVREYEIEFNNLRRYAGRELDEESVQMRRFMRGLRLELRNVCQVRNYSSVAELVEKAAQLESGLAEAQMREENRVRTIPQGRSGSGTRPRYQKGDASARGKPAVAHDACKICGKRHPGFCRYAVGACLRCGGKDHQIRDCPKEDLRRKDARPASVRCYNCGGVGHIQMNCPNRMQSSGKRASEGLPPPPKRQAVAPRVYSLAAKPSDPSTSRPISGKSYRLP